MLKVVEKGGAHRFIDVFRAEEGETWGRRRMRRVGVKGKRAFVEDGRERSWAGLRPTQGNESVEEWAVWTRWAGATELGSEVEEIAGVGDSDFGPPGVPQAVVKCGEGGHDERWYQEWAKRWKVLVTGYEEGWWRTRHPRAGKARGARRRNVGV